MQITCYTDGSSRGNPGRGGWGVYVEAAKDGLQKSFSLSGGSIYTTNNRMEISAVARALKFLDSVLLNKYFVNQKGLGEKVEIIIKTDSQYVRNGITSWIENWQKNNWRTANKKEVLNKDLWIELLNLKNIINEKLTERGCGEIKFEYVKAHVGIHGNEMADKLATEAADKIEEEK